MAVGSKQTFAAVRANLTVAAAKTFAAEGAAPTQQIDGCVSNGKQCREQEIYRFDTPQPMISWQAPAKQREQQNLTVSDS